MFYRYWLNFDDQISSEETFDNYIIEDIHLNFRLNKIGENNVSIVMKTLKNKFNSGLDGISNSLIKNSSGVLGLSCNQ